MCGASFMQIAGTKPENEFNFKTEHVRKTKINEKMYYFVKK